MGKVTLQCSVAMSNVLLTTVKFVGLLGITERKINIVVQKLMFICSRSAGKSQSGRGGAEVKRNSFLVEKQNPPQYLNFYKSYF